MSFVARAGSRAFAPPIASNGKGDPRKQHLKKIAKALKKHHQDKGSYPPAAIYDKHDEARLLGRNRVWCYTRRPRVSIEVPVFYDSPEPSLAGFSHDLSPSGLFVHTAVPVDMGMRCALAFPLPDHRGKVHVVGRIVRTVPETEGTRVDGQVPGMGIEFESFGRGDRWAIESFLHANESRLRPEHGATLSA